MFPVEMLLDHPFLVTGLTSTFAYFVSEEYINYMLVLILTEVVMYSIFFGLGFLSFHAQPYLPHGVAYDSSNGIEVVENYIRPDDRYLGYDSSFTIKNHSNENFKDVRFYSSLYECTDKPDIAYGSKLPEKGMCVTAGFTDMLQTPHDAEYKAHTDTEFKYHGVGVPVNKSHGKYPYIFWKINVISLDTGYQLGYHVGNLVDSGKKYTNESDE